MEIINGVEIMDSALLIEKRILIIADLHMGYEEALNKQGILIPRNQFKETEKKLNELFIKLEKIKLEAIVINGDLKHEFGKISEQEWNETKKVLELLKKHCKNIILIRGNHDKILDPIANKNKLKIVDYYIVNGKEKMAIIHGNKIFDSSEIKTAETLIIGHEHPAISLEEGPKRETYKCFLLGKWGKQKLIVMPSFLPIIEGSDIRKEKLLSPYLKQKMGNFEIFVVGDKIYRFGKLKGIK